MLLASFGSPSALGYATSNIVRRIGSEIFGTHLFIQAANLEEFKQHWHSVDFPIAPHNCLGTFKGADRYGGGRFCCFRGMAFAPAVRFTTPFFAERQAHSVD